MRAVGEPKVTILRHIGCTRWVAGLYSASTRLRQRPGEPTVLETNPGMYGRQQVLDRVSKTFFGVALVVLVVSSHGLAQEKKVKDQGEFDIYTQAVKETDPVKKLALLDQWKEKYPDSDFKMSGRWQWRRPIARSPRGR